MRTGCIITLYWVLVFPLPIWGQPSFSLNGSAEIISENCYRLTSHKVSNDAGSIWCEYPTQLNHAFDIRFSVNLGCSSYAGEGIAFVMHTSKEKYDALGCADAAMGFGQATGCQNVISPSLAVEFDTRFTKGQADLYVPHIAVVRDGNFAAPLQKAVRMRDGGRDVRDCEYHNVRICWLPSRQLLEVYFDDELRLTYKGDIASIFGKEKNIYIGFTGGSGTQANMQMICIQSVDVQVDEDFEQKRSFEEGVGIYPNPIREKLTIDLNFDKELDVQIQLYSATGKLIYEIPMHKVKQNQYFFNMPGLPSGVYYVTATDGYHRVSRKIVHISTIRA